MPGRPSSWHACSGSCCTWPATGARAGWCRWQRRGGRRDDLSRSDGRARGALSSRESPERSETVGYGRRRRGSSMRTQFFALVIGAALVAAACSGGSGASAGASGGAATKVRFQLKWVAQAQFAGYYAAIDQGYYKDEGLDVTLVLGGPNIDEVQAVAAGNAEIGHDLAAEHAALARGRHRPGLDRPGLPALRDAHGRRSRTRTSRSPRTSAGKKVGVVARRQRARAVRRDDQGEPRSDQGKHHQAELQHGRPAQRRPRCRAGDDLQRVRPDPRGEEPRHG